MNNKKFRISGGKDWLQRLAIALIIGGGAALVVEDVFDRVRLFDKLTFATIDRRFEQRGPLVRDGTDLDVVIVGISRESFANAPHPYPFPRDYYARLIRNLNRLGADVIGIDLVFDIPAYQHPEHDRELFETIRDAGNTVLAGVIRGVERRGDAAAVVVQEEDSYGNIFFPADSSLGFVQMRKDPDGVIRRYPVAMLTHGRGRLLPSFGFAVMNRFDGRNPLQTPGIDGRFFNIGDRRIPRVAEAAYINYYGPSGTFTQFDLIDIIDDETFRTLDELRYGVDLDVFYDFEEWDPFRGRVVLVGPLFPESQDLHPTPVHPPGRSDFNEMYGVEIHANMIQTMIDANYLYTLPPAGSALFVILTALFIFITTSVIKSIRGTNQTILEAVAILWGILGILLIFYIGDWYFIHRNLITPVTGPAAAVILAYFGSAIHQYLTERRQKEIVKSIFSHYVTPAIVNELLSDPDKLRLGGEKRELTVLFSDIAGFTSISEGMTPENLVELLNEYLDAMTDVIIRNKGTLDKYEGDAIMAFWGAPIPLNDHALHASLSAIQMQRRLRDLRENFRVGGKKRLDMHMRVGINTGDMIVGNMGGKERFDYTVIGDSVNLGARLETANKMYGTSIIVSENTYRHVKDLAIVRELDTIVVKGKTQITKIYELVGMQDDGIPADVRTKCDMYSKGMVLYRERRWQKAAEHFSELVSIYPYDKPSKIYLERSKMYLENPPPADWNGVTVMDIK
jgi:adenylate cyclase